MSEQETNAAAIESHAPQQQQLRRAHDTVSTRETTDDIQITNVEETDFPINPIKEDKTATEVRKDILTEKKELSTNENENFDQNENDKVAATDEAGDIKDIFDRSEDINKSSNKNDKENLSTHKERKAVADVEKRDKTNSEEEDVTTTAAESSASSKDCYSPVITVTKVETTLTKGDLKMQRVVVSEDISDNTSPATSTSTATEQDKPGVTHRFIRSEVLAVSMRTDGQAEHDDKEQTEGENQKDLKKVQTKIPKLRLKQVVEKIRKQKEEKLNKEEVKTSIEQKQHSSIPRLKDTKTLPNNKQNYLIENKNTQDIDSPKVDDEFDKIYEEIIENEALNNVPSPEKISDPIKLESKFEEIIHAYDEHNIQPIVIEKPKSKIPLLKRKSEHDIVIPPPTTRKHSLKRSNTEDFKGNIPIAVTVSKETPLKTSAETNTSNVISTTKSYKTNTGIHSEVLVKTITTQTSIDINKINMIASTGDDFTKPEKSRDDNLKEAIEHEISISNIETDKNKTINILKRNESGSGTNSDKILINNVELINDNKAILKTVTTQTSVEIKKLDTSLTSENIIKLEKSNNGKEKNIIKCQIPVSNETIKTENIISHKIHETNAGIQSSNLTINNVEPRDKFNKPNIKTVTTQMSIQTNKLDETLSKEKVVIRSEKKSEVNLKNIAKCKIPVALNPKENIATKINSVPINKDPTTINVIERSNQTKSDETENVTDKKVEKPPTHDIKSATLLLQSDKLYKRDSQISGSLEIDTNVSTGESFLLQERKTLEIGNANNVKKVSQIETKNFISHMPTIPTIVTKYEKKTNITKKELDSSQNISSLNNAEHEPHPAVKPDHKGSYLIENNDFNAKSPEQSSKKTVNTDQPNNVSDVIPTENKNNIIYPTSPTSDNYDYGIKNNDIVVIKTKEIYIKDVKPEYNSTNTIVKDSKFSVQYHKNKNESESNKSDDNAFKTVPKHVENIDYQSEELNEDGTTKQVTNKSERNPESPIKTIINDDESQTQNLPTRLKNIHESGDLNQKQSNESLKRPLNLSDTKPIDNLEIVNEQITPINTKANSIQKNQEKERNSKAEDSSLSTNIEDKEEEDIILLKGKVNRVIRRLDSKDHKTIKKEVDDLPVEVSVISKIAMFERSESTDNSTFLKNEFNVNTEVTHECNVVNDKPKVVSEILKTDINHNLIHKNESTSVTDETSEINTLNNVNSNTTDGFKDVRVSKIDNKRVFKTKNSLNEGRPLRRTRSTVAADQNEVFAGGEGGPSSLEVWKEYRRKKELDLEMRRAYSLAELELELGAEGEVRGRVRRLVARLSEAGHAGPVRHEARDRERVAGSVSQRIALYESKLAPARGEQRPPTPATAPPASSSSISDEQLQLRLNELRGARAQYGSVLVPTTELSDGARMPVLALGTANLEPELVTAVVSAAIELGFRAIDTAPVYGSERKVGRAIRDKIADGTVTRSELFIISKLWSTSHRRELVEEACQRSLEALGLEYVDLYLIHNPMSFKEGPNPVPKIANVIQYSSHDYLEAWFGIEGLVKKGLVRSAGLSNFNSVQVERVLEKGRIKPVVNQVECHPYLNQLRLDEFCAARHIKLSCFGVLGSKGTPAEYTSGLAPVIDDPLVKVMAAGLGVTPAQLLISYQLRLGRAVVVKSARASHLSQTVAATVAEPLDAATVAALSALNRNKRIFTFIGMGDTHRNYPFRIPF